VTEFGLKEKEEELCEFCWQVASSLKENHPELFATDPFPSALCQPPSKSGRLPLARFYNSRNEFANPFSKSIVQCRLLAA